MKDTTASESTAHAVRRAPYLRAGSDPAYGCQGDKLPAWGLALATLRESSEMQLQLPCFLLQKTSKVE